MMVKRMRAPRETPMPIAAWWAMESFAWAGVDRQRRRKEISRVLERGNKDPIAETGGYGKDVNVVTGCCERDEVENGRSRLTVLALL